MLCMMKSAGWPIVESEPGLEDYRDQFKAMHVIMVSIPAVKIPTCLVEVADSFSRIIPGYWLRSHRLLKSLM